MEKHLLQGLSTLRPGACAILRQIHVRMNRIVVYTVEKKLKLAAWKCFDSSFPEHRGHWYKCAWLGLLRVSETVPTWSMFSGYHSVVSSQYLHVSQICHSSGICRQLKKIKHEFNMTRICSKHKRNLTTIVIEPNQVWPSSTILHSTRLSDFGRGHDVKYILLGKSWLSAKKAE